MPEPVGCPVCRQAGPACGPCSVPIAAQPEPCIMPACGEATIVRSPCGAARHYHGTSNHLIAPGKRIEVAAPPGERIEIAAPGRRIEPEWKGQAVAQDCDRCMVPGTWCGPGRVWPVTLPCDGCGMPTAWSAKCGRMRCLTCAGGGQAPAEVHPAQRYPGPDGRPDWKGQAAARKAAQAGKEQPILRAELLDAGVPGDRLGAAVAMWNELMRGIDYNGPHRTALGILNGTFKHRGIPDLPPVTAAELAPPGDGPVWSARSWLIRHHDEDGALDRECPICRDVVTRAGADLASFDVNGMYLSAAASDLGTGDPVRTDWPDESVLKRAGWVRVSTLEGALWSIGERWAEGMWMPIPLVVYLRDAGAEFLMVEAVTQDRQRRWLDPHVDLMRSARAELLEAGTPESLAVLNIVKSIYTRMFGGLLESKRHNDSDTLRPWWKAAITATGQARMFRGLDKARDTRSMTPVVGLHVDAAWFVMPHGYEVPPGLQVSAQLGKFKPAGRTPWTPELAAAWGRGEPRPLWQALHESEVSA